MFAQHIIAKKRDGAALSAAEIAAFVRGATDGSWADYQLSAMLMAIFLRGMSAEETAQYTTAIMRSGRVANLAAVPGRKVDKHSTGGVGDKVSLVLAPMVAACGVPVPMICGRGLGHTGGTVDKLEAIPGFRSSLSIAEYEAQVASIGCALVGQSESLAPADRKLYALRDVTSTVECTPLICGSILGKKLAGGADALVFDIKFGAGAFMKTEAAARELAAALTETARAAGRSVRAVLSAMDQPLGRSVGNALEVAEAIAALRGAGPVDLMELCMQLGAQMLILGGVAQSQPEAEAQLSEALRSGRALEKMRELIRAQGGDTRVLHAPEVQLPQAPYCEPLFAPRTGIVARVDALGVALAALRLGAGRARAEDAIDPAVGFSDLVKIGQPVAAGAVLGRVHARTTSALAEARAALSAAIEIAEAPAALDSRLSKGLVA